VPPLLRCPHCHRPLTRTGTAWGCAAGHRFDVARQGHVTLAGGPLVHTGDDAAMLDARAAVLAAGHLDVVTDALVDALGGALPAGALVEVGAGTAHHLLRVQAARPGRAAVAVDVSAAAARRAARAGGDRLLSVRADVWRPWPLLDHVAAAVLGVFGPRNPAEAARVLVPGGRLVVVTPAFDHLAGIAGPLGLLGVEPDKHDRLLAEVGGHLDLVDVHEVRDTRRIDRGTARDLAAMGPSAHHVAPEDLDARVASLPSVVEVTVAVVVTRFRAG
jgi:23S rRNA (guanine745-N1)-methyltransferase